MGVVLCYGSKLWTARRWTGKRLKDGIAVQPNERDMSAVTRCGYATDGVTKPMDGPGGEVMRNGFVTTERMGSTLEDGPCVPAGWCVVAPGRELSVFFGGC